MEKDIAAFMKKEFDKVRPHVALRRGEKFRSYVTCDEQRQLHLHVHFQRALLLFKAG